MHLRRPAASWLEQKFELERGPSVRRSFPQGFQLLTKPRLLPNWSGRNPRRRRPDSARPSSAGSSGHRLGFTGESEFAMPWP